MTNTTATISTMVSNTESVSNRFGATFDMGSTLTGINTGIQAFYGTILALSLLGIIGAIILTCCTVVKARHIIYCTCTFLLMLGLVSFILLIAFGILYPNVAQICSYVDRKLATGAGTT